MRSVKDLRARILRRKFLYYFMIISVSYGAGRYFAPAATAQAAQLPAEEFSEAALLAFMDELGIKYPETALSQARLETGNFSSDIFFENHNLFGMKVAQKRPTTALGTSRGHATYRNWKDSVIDYALFQSYAVSKLPKNNVDEYRNYLKKFYSETSDYLNRIDRMLSESELTAVSSRSFDSLRNLE